MINVDLAFKTLAVLHGVFGGLLFGFAAHPETKPDFHKGRNLLVGDIYKFLAFGVCWSLIFCGVGAFINPVIAVIAAWTSIGFYILTGYVDPVVARRLPSIGKSIIINLVVRAIAAGVLTSLGVMLRHG